MKNKSQDFRPSPFTSVGLRSFITFCKPWRLKIIFVSLLFIISSAILAFQPVFIGKLVDTATKQPFDTQLAWYYAIALIAVSIGHDLLWHAAEFAFRAYLFVIHFQYESFLFRQVIAKPYPYFVDKFTGKIGSYVTTLSTELGWLLDNAMFGYISSLVSVISVVAIMTTVNWQTAAVVAGSLVAMLIVGRYTMAQDMRYQKRETDKNSTKNGHIIDAIGNFVSVKSFRKEAAEYDNLDAQQHETYIAGRQSFLWAIVFWASMSFIIRNLTWPLIVALNVWMLLNGQISVGQFTTVLATALLFTQTIWEVVWNISQFGQRVAKIEEAHTYLFGAVNVVKQPIYSGAKTTRATHFKNEFSIHDLSFAYPDKPDTSVLTGITLSIKKGEKIGIVGKSGSGKSTLVKLLLGQYDTPAGVFAFDGRDVSGDTVSSAIAYVPQDTALFHRSIAENISYAADKKVSKNKIVHAAKQAEADEFITKLSEQYETLVGERGVKLSGGQRQRIAIARAILRDAPVLVLDEATSALDSESEVLVQKALERLWDDKTVIAIAHRLSTLRNMDRIIVMNDGMITEQGTHAELLAMKGEYAKLWHHQSGGFIEE